MSGKQLESRTEGSAQTHLASEDVRDPHFVIVDDVRKMISRQAVRFPEDKVFEWERVVVDRVVDQVFLGQSPRGTLL